MDRKSFLLASMMVNKGDIPSRYTKVDYIESHGTEFIDTGIVASSGFRFEVVLSFNSRTSKDTIIGSHNTYPPFGRNFIGKYRGDRLPFPGLELGLGENYLPIVEPPLNEYIKIEGNTFNNGTANILSVNGEIKYNSTQFSNGGRSSNHLLMFTNQYYIEHPEGDKLVAKIKYAKVWDTQDVLLGYLISVLDTQTNEYGLYDKVSKQFFGNLGTGAFSGGNDYTRVDYIQSSGTQYIDTGVSAPNGFIIKTKMSMSNSGNVYSSNEWRCLCGSHESSSPYKRNFVMINYNQRLSNAGVISCGQGNGDKYARNDNIYLDTIYDIEASNIYNNTYIKINGENKTLTTEPTPTNSYSSRNLYLFADNNGSSLSNPSQYFYGKMCATQIIVNNVIVRDFIPVINTQTNEYGLYDKVSKQFFGNLGTGAFSGGND